MTSTPAIEWLHATTGIGHRDQPGHAAANRGPMITLNSDTDAGTPMTGASADYADPARWWL
jgi:hypothetical protein